MTPVDVAAGFERRFGHRPEVVMQAPGRVNLIGEHTDYSLLPVLPMAIDRAVFVAAGLGPAEEVVASSSTEPEGFHRSVDDLEGDMEGWHRYLAAAVRTVGPDPRGASLWVESDLPATGGLSSSSAFTVGVLAALDRLWSRGHLAEDLIGMSAAAERLIGVESGAMDQTVISLARAGHALRIDFDPFAVRHIPIPADIRVVAAYSGSPAPKGGSAQDQYNTRVVACRAATLLLAAELGTGVRTPPVLADVADRTGPRITDLLPERATAREVALSTGVGVAVMTRLTNGSFDPDRSLPVRVVAHHVLSERLRVDEAGVALERDDLGTLGRLLDASHASLQGFGASSEALDRLTGAMRDAGAAGARITGAGFGGYAVAMCRPGMVAQVVAAAVGATGGPAFEVIPSAGVGEV